jgi:aldose 1-epimerase
MLRTPILLTTMLVPFIAIAFAGSAESAGVEKKSWGKAPSGEAVDLYTLTNSKGHSVSISTWGAIITSIKVPDKSGALGDVVHGFDTLDGYLGKHPFFGAIVGRYGNRIGGAKFAIDGKTYTLAKNDGDNTLHGGVKGFDKYVWMAKPTAAHGAPSLVLTHVSPDGDEGFPGQLTVTLTYTWTENDELRMHYVAQTTKPTVVNLTNHSYFNLAGKGTILEHQLQLSCDRYTPVVKGLIPTGELPPVEGTPFDFRKATAIGARIDAANDQIALGGGYDHNFVVNGAAGTLRPAAHVVDPSSGRTLDVITTEPGVQFYTGNFLDGTVVGKGGTHYVKRSAFCLETQHYPDSPNQKTFPSTVLRPGQTYNTTTIFKFGVAQ